MKCACRWGVAAGASILISTGLTPVTASGQAQASDDEAVPFGPRQPVADKDAQSAVVWDEDWPRLRTWQYAAIGAQAAVALGALAIPPGGGRLALPLGPRRSLA